MRARSLGIALGVIAALATAAGCATGGAGETDHPDGAMQGSDATSGAETGSDAGTPPEDARSTKGCDAATQTDPFNCGTCGHTCGSGESCSCGTCQSACQGSLTSCCGQCVDTATDPKNCGSCGNQCLPPDNAVATCAGMACSFTCEADAGLTRCEADSGTPGCYDLTSSSIACGACGKTCSGSDSCVGRACVSSVGGYVTTTPKPGAFLDACTLTGHKTVLTNVSKWQAAAAVTLPFSFSFFAAAQTSVWIQSKGTLGFGTDMGATSYPDCKKFNPTTGYQAAVAFGDPGLATGSAGVCYATTGSGSSRQFVVTWSGATLSSQPGSDLTFSIVLSEGTDTLDFVYKTAAPGDAGSSAAVEGASATVGIQQSGSVNTPYSCHKAFIATTPFDVRFTPG